MTLSDQQLAFFETFGYLTFPGAFADEAERITVEFERVWAEHGGGHNRQAHDHERRSALVPFIDQSEYLSALLDDPRIDGVVSALLGDDYNYTGSDGNFYVGDTRWHSDGFARMKYRSIKIALYLDPVTRDSGCLRVIPGSHIRGDGYAEGPYRRSCQAAGRRRSRSTWASRAATCPRWRWNRNRATWCCSFTI